MEKYSSLVNCKSIEMLDWVMKMPFFTNNDRLVYCFILKNTNKSLFSISRNTIADICGTSEKTVKRTFKKLEEYGIIYNKKRVGLGKPNIYNVIIKPDEVFELASKKIKENKEKLK